MPAMTEPDTTPAAGPDAGADPQRLVLADLVAGLVTGVATQARNYEVAARQAEGDLRQALDGLRRAKHAQAADLAPLARALEVRAPLVPPASPPDSARSWGVILGEAFQEERALEWTSRELAVLAEDVTVKAVAARLAAGAARDGREVRKLYLRYS
jgi:hypothetical protein